MYVKMADYQILPLLLQSSKRERATDIPAKHDYKFKDK